MSTWFLNIPRDDDFSGQPFPWHQRHGHSTAPTFPWKSSYDLAFSTHWALLHFSTALHLSRKHRACYPACSTNLGSKIPSLMSPPCSRCGKPTLRWCPRNRPEKTKMWFIILLPVTISCGCKKPWCRGKASPEFQHVRCFHPCIFLWSFGGQQAIPASHSQLPRSTGITPVLLQPLLQKHGSCCKHRQR